MKYKRTLPNLIILASLLTIFTGCGGGDSETAPVPDAIPKNPQCAGANIAEGYSCSLIDDRESIVYKPSSDTSDGIALFLHGAPGNATKVMGIFDAKMIADKYNLVALAPKGIRSVWGWTSRIDGNQTENADVAYIEQLIEQVRAENNIASDKVYVFGYSAGGFMAYTLACAIPEKITAIVSLAGQFRGDFAACSTSTPMNVHHLHSVTDSEVPYSGRSVGTIQSVDDTIGHWLLKNGCDNSVEAKEQQGVTSASAGTTTEIYQNCLSSVALSKLENVPHEASYIAEKLHDIYSYLLTSI